MRGPDLARTGKPSGILSVSSSPGLWDHAVKHPRDEEMEETPKARRARDLVPGVASLGIAAVG